MTNGTMAPSARATTPSRPALRASRTLTSKAVATMAKSRSMPPPITARPANSGRSAIPFLPPVSMPPAKASARPMTMAMAEPWMRPAVSRWERE
jgi:hypothetical protein